MALCAGFLATVFDVFRSNQVSVDVVATSEVSISLSLDPKKCWHDGEVGGMYFVPRLVWMRVHPVVKILLGGGGGGGAVQCN